MSIIQKIALILMLLFLLLLYLFRIKSNNNKPIKIEPIKIEALSTATKQSSSKIPMESSPEDILSKLKVASMASRQILSYLKEDEPRKILNALKNQIAQQEIITIPEKKEIAKAKKIVLKKTVIKKSSPKVTNRKKIVSKKLILKKESKVKVVKKKVIVPKIELKAKIFPKSTEGQNLSREEEVTLYKNKYASTLEVVNVSKSFEIQEKNTLPDEHYFEPITTIKVVKQEAPLTFVKKLGVVKVSNKYESNFSIPEKIEVAKEGIVTISSASIETLEMKNLKFVDTLGVIKVSEAFESIEAKKHLD